MVTGTKNKNRKADKMASSSREGVSPMPCTEITGEQIKHEHIAARAYELWAHSGYGHGNHKEHWFRAKNELCAETSCAELEE